MKFDVQIAHVKTEYTTETIEADSLEEAEIKAKTQFEDDAFDQMSHEHTIVRSVDYAEEEEI